MSTIAEDVFKFVKNIIKIPENIADVRSTESKIINKELEVARDLCVSSLTLSDLVLGRRNSPLCAKFREMAIQNEKLVKDENGGAPRK